MTSLDNNQNPDNEDNLNNNNNEVNKDSILNNLYFLISKISNIKELETWFEGFINFFGDYKNWELNYFINIIFSHLFLKINEFYSKSMICDGIEGVLLILLNNKNIVACNLNVIEKIAIDYNLELVKEKIDTIKQNKIEDINSLNLVSFKKLIQNNLEKLFDNKTMKEKNKYSKRLGLSLLDLRGNFIWYDDISEKYFEKKHLLKKGIDQLNLFEIMIPDSKLYLFNKFGPNLFDLDNNIVKDSITFSYVIYSHSRLNNLLKIKKNSKNIYKTKNIEVEDEKEIYYKYLTALSSKATLIKLELDKNDILNYTQENGINIKLDNNILSSLNSNNRIEIFAIFLETRSSKTIPKFNYNKLKNDVIIKNFENILKTKLQKQNGKLKKKSL